jgi:hypothetical protein
MDSLLLCSSAYGFAYLGFMVLLSSNIKKQGVLQVESEGGGH